MHEAAFDEPHARHQVEQVATDARRHQRRHPTRAVHGERTAHAIKRDALDPLHDDARHAGNLAAAKQARKTLQTRKLRVAFILALKRRPDSPNAARMLLVRFRTMTLRLGQKLQRHVLALRVARVLHAPRAAAVAFAFQHEQRDETTPIRRAIGISQHKRRLETLNARNAHGRRGRCNRKRPCSRIATARISTPPAHKLILASTSLSWAAVTLLPFASWSFQMGSIQRL